MIHLDHYISAGSLLHFLTDFDTIKDNYRCLKEIIMHHKGIMGIILGICLTGLFLAGCGMPQGMPQKDERPVIKLGSDRYPPFNYFDEDGVPTGIDVDLATEAFGRMGYRVEVHYIDWEKKKDLLKSGELDCIMACFSMEGRLDDYQWAGSYMVSRQVVAVNPSSQIYHLQDLAGKTLAVQSTTKPEGIFLRRNDPRIPKLENLLSMGDRALIYTLLGKGYADAIGAHETSILQYMKDYDVEYRILPEPLMTVGIGVAFDKEDRRSLCQELDKTLREMRQDGTSERIIGKYLENPKQYLEVEKLAY